MAEPKPKPTLLTLPFEIREKIWKYFCADSDLYLESAVCKCDYDSEEHCSCGYQANYNRCEILLVCRQTYAETTKLFMQSTQGWRDNVTYLEIPCDYSFTLDLMEIPIRLRNLKVLRLYYPVPVGVMGLHRNASFWRDMAADRALRYITGGVVDLLTIVHRCPDIDIGCERRLRLKPCSGAREDEKFVSYAAIFRGKNMTITFHYHECYGAIKKSELDEEDCPIESKVVELPDNEGDHEDGTVLRVSGVLAGVGS